MAAPGAAAISAGQRRRHLEALDAHRHLILSDWLLEPPPIVSHSSADLSQGAWRSRDASASGLDDNERALNAIAKFSDDVDHRLTERPSHTRRETNQDDARCVALNAERKLAEVFVFGQHDPVFRACPRENHIVLCAWSEFSD
jgi:hypothetical protein